MVIKSEWHHPDVKVKRTAPPLTQHGLYHITNNGVGVDWVAHTNCVENVRTAVLERVMYTKSGRPPVEETRLEEHLSGVWSWLSKHCPIVPMLSEQQLAECYHGRKRTVVERAFESLKQVALRPKDAKVQAFVKREKANITAKPRPVPRLIQPRNPRYCASLSQFLKPMEGPMCRLMSQLWNERHEGRLLPVVMKGMNAEQQGQVMHQKWQNFSDPVAIALDAERFDQHVQQPALRWEHRVWLRMCPPRHRSKLRAMLREQLTTRGVAYMKDGVVRYTKQGMRSSGDPNTSSGNCLLMCCMLWAFCEAVSAKRRSLANNGDDCVLILERTDALRVRDAIRPFFLECGFSMKVGELIDVFERVEFCQTQPIWTPSGYVMVRDPRVALDKDSCTVTPLLTTNGVAKWASANGVAGLRLTGQIPVWQNFYRSLIVTEDTGKITETEEFQMSGRAIMSRGMTRTFGPVHPRTRLSFWLAFDQLPDEQMAREAIYDKLEPVR